MALRDPRLPLRARTGATVAPGEVFELTKWVPAEQAALRIWLWPSTLSEPDILAAAAAVNAAGITSVADPADEPWTHILCWDGTNWTLQKAGAPSPEVLGPKLTAAALKAHLGADAKLWVNLPAPKELATRLIPSDPASALKVAANLKDADYALAGVLTANGPAYAWFHKGELVAGPPTGTADHSPGCSATSQYPVRSDWVTMAGPGDLDATGDKLGKYSSLLVKVHGWLDLADSPADASSDTYYSLAMVPAVAPPAGAESTPAAQPDAPVKQGDQLKMALASSERVIDRRWVYVLDIDCHGRGSLLYPVDFAENQFPNDSDSGRQFLLPGARTLRIGPPYGVDTLILLSTAQPLPDPSALNFEGVATRGARGMDSPLEKLLADTSKGTRGLSGEVPTNWGIALTTMRSVPKQTAQ